MWIVISTFLRWRQRRRFLVIVIYLGNIFFSHRPFHLRFLHTNANTNIVFYCVCAHDRHERSPNCQLPSMRTQEICIKHRMFVYLHLLLRRSIPSQSMWLQPYVYGFEKKVDARICLLSFFLSCLANILFFTNACGPATWYIYLWFFFF